MFFKKITDLFNPRSPRVLLGTITDGDARRALLAGKKMSVPVTRVMLGLAQIEQLEHFVIQKRQLSSVYAEWLDDYADIRFFSEPAKARSNYWLNAIFLPNRESRDDLLKRANECGVMTRPMLLAWQFNHDNR